MPRFAPPRSAPRHDRDAGGPTGLLAGKAVLADKAALRTLVWEELRAAAVARFPGATGRIPNFTGAEAAAERLRGLPEWAGARTVKANPDSPQLRVRQRALEDGKTLYMLEWADLTDEKIAAIPVLSRLRAQADQALAPRLESFTGALSRRRVAVDGLAGG
jgi:hypothetical protein